VTALVALVLLLQGTATPQRAPVVTARVTPEAPAVGEPITIELRVRAPRGSTIRFPVLPDTGTRIEPLDPRSVREVASDDGVERTAMYRLIAWDTGRVDVVFSDIVVSRDGADQRYPVRLGELRIRSLLPRDTAQRVPREARPLMESSTMPWRWWVAGAVVLFLSWWGWKQWRARRAAAALQDPGAAVRARAAFAHLRSFGLLAAGEPGRHALGHVAVLRKFVGERWTELPTPLTAAELAERAPAVDFPILPERLVTLVRRAEALAYAGAPIENAEAERMGIEATAIVEDLEKAWRARVEREQQAAQKIRRRPMR
jgi:hypothetical protein